MNKQKQNFLTVGLLSLLVLGFAAWFLLKSPDEISASERRRLATRPPLQAGTLLSGAYASRLETYLQDQLPLRAQLRCVHAVTLYSLLQQRDVDGVYLSQGYAAKLEDPLDEASVQYAAGRFQALYDTLLRDTDCRVYLSVIPDKSYFLAASAGRPFTDDQVLAELLRAQTPFAEYIDLFGSLCLEDYYKTDSHWRQERLQPAAKTLAEAMGVGLSGAGYTQNTLERPFTGVYAGYSALPMKPEPLCYLTSPTLESAEVWNYETGAAGSVYDFEKAAGLDAYELFLSGSVSLISMENPNAGTDRELIIFRDSFASSLAPLLLEGYRKITLVDVRYLGSERVGNYLSFENQDVLFLYSASVLNHSETLK